MRLGDRGRRKYCIYEKLKQKFRNHDPDTSECERGSGFR